MIIWLKPDSSITNYPLAEANGNEIRKTTVILYHLNFIEMNLNRF